MTISSNRGPSFSIFNDQVKYEFNLRRLPDIDLSRIYSRVFVAVQGNDEIGSRLLGSVPQETPRWDLIKNLGIVRLRTKIKSPLVGDQSSLVGDHRKMKRLFDFMSKRRSELRFNWVKNILMVEDSRNYR